MFIDPGVIALGVHTLVDNQFGLLVSDTFELDPGESFQVITTTSHLENTANEVIWTASSPNVQYWQDDLGTPGNCTARSPINAGWVYDCAYAFVNIWDTYFLPLLPR